MTHDPILAHDIDVLIEYLETVKLKSQSLPRERTTEIRKRVSGLTMHIIDHFVNEGVSIPNLEAKTLALVPMVDPLAIYRKTTFGDRIADTVERLRAWWRK